MAIDGKKLYNQFWSIYSKLSYMQRISIAAISAATVVVVAALVYWANIPTYSTLFGSLSKEDTVAIVDKLDAQNIKYVVENEDTIKVPQDQVYGLRLQLAKLGLPKGGSKSGFELFDNASFGQTEFQENVNYQRALEGELERSIMSLGSVKEARVHLYIPKNPIYVTDSQDKAKASVVLNTLKDDTLTQDQVRAIAFFVSGAVKNLDAKNVQIMNTKGDLLSEFLSKDNEPYYLTQTQLQYKQRIESNLESKLNSILTRTSGNDKFVAKVTVDMDFSKKDTVIEDFGDQPVLRSQYQLDIASKSKGVPVEGIPGVEPNLAEPNILNNSMYSEYSKAESTANYEIDKTTTHETKDYGTISRLTVAVVVDDKLDSTTNNGSSEVKSRSWTQAELQNLRDVVASTVGFDQNRGDTLQVQNIPFDTSDAPNADYLQRQKIMEILNMVLKYVLALVVLVVFYFLVIRPILRKIEIAQEIDDTMLGDTASDAHLASLDLAVGGDGAFPKTLEELEQEVESELGENVPMDVDSVRSKVMLKKIEETANEDPEMVANLLKTVMKGS